MIRLSFYYLPIFIIFQFSLSGADLILSITNNTGQNITISNNSTSHKNSFKSCEIKFKEKLTKSLDMEDNSVLKLGIHGEHGQDITDFNITYKVPRDKDLLKYYVPCAGPITGVGCSWDKLGRVELKKFISRKTKSLIPFFTNSEIELSLNLTELPKSDQNNLCDMELTLFALPGHSKVEKVELDSTEIGSQDLDNTHFDLSGRGVKIKSSLAPVVYRGKNRQSRWVDLILHNFTSSTFIFYALKQYPGNEHIKFEYKNEKFKDSINFH